MSSITYAYDSSFRLNCLTNSTIKSRIDINVRIISTYNVNECSTNLCSSCSTNSCSRASTSKQNDSSNPFITMAYRPSPLLWHSRLVTFRMPVWPQTWPASVKITQQSSDIVSSQSDRRSPTYGSSCGLAHCHLFVLLLCSARTCLCTYTLLCRAARRGVYNSLVTLLRCVTYDEQTQ
jgi:hypothetical protein